MSSTAEQLSRTWERLHPLPFGKQAFSRLFGLLVPYTGSIRPEVVELAPGYAKVRLYDRRAVRNHLSSIHAIALMNLGEATSGLAMNVGLPSGARAIVTGLSIDYTKKARGVITAECRVEIPDFAEQREHLVDAVMKDESGDVVATMTAKWLVGPRPTA